MKSIRIAIFTDTFYPNADGVVTSVMHLAEGLAKKGHNLLVVAPDYSNLNQRYPWHENIKVVRIHSTALPTYKDFRFVSPLFHRCIKELRAFHPDIIHFQTYSTLGWAAVISAKRLNLPLVGTFHTFFADGGYLKHVGLDFKFAKKMAWMYAKKLYDSCNLVTCPSETTGKALLANYFKEGIRVISNGMDGTIFNNDKYKEVKRKYNPDGPLLLFIGRIAHEKNISFLIDSFRMVVSKIPNAKLLLVGSGPQTEEVEKQIAKSGLKDHVIMLGGITHKKLVKSSIFGACDLFVTASKTENQPMTVLEAQANGLVCVGLKAGGMVDLVKDSYNGYLLGITDKKGFAEKIVKLLFNKKLMKRMKRNTLIEVKKHSMSQVISTWEKTYSELISKNKLEYKKENHGRKISR